VKLYHGTNKVFDTFDVEVGVGAAYLFKEKDRELAEKWAAISHADFGGQSEGPIVCTVETSPDANIVDFNDFEHPVIEQLPAMLGWPEKYKNKAEWQKMVKNNVMAFDIIDYNSELIKMFLESGVDGVYAWDGLDEIGEDLVDIVIMFNRDKFKIVSCERLETDSWGGMKVPYEKIFESWRGYVSEMNLGEPPKSVGYTAYVLDEESQAKLINHAPSEWKIHSHHMTLISPTEQKMGRLPARWHRFNDCLTVVGIAHNDFVVAAKIDMKDIPMPFKIQGIPHITIATNPTKDGKPAMSNEFVEQDFIPVEAFNVCGGVEELFR
tara:strand:- start:4669 stop:5637 length:969 start_codon:yes stop_codon:yes gene_type:complete